MRGLRFAVILASSSGIAWLACTIATVAGPGALVDRETLRVFFLETPFGGPAALRLVLLAALLGVAMLPLAEATRAAVLLPLAAMLLVSQAWFGHAADGGPHATVTILAYAVHVVAAAAWVGSLPPLTGMLGRYVRGTDGAADLSMILERFSVFAAPVAGAIVLSGIVNTMAHGGRDVAALLASRWGEILCVKIAMVAAMLALSCFNRCVLMPRLRRRQKAAPDLTRLLYSSARAEAALGLLVLGGAAVLGLTPPPH